MAILGPAAKEAAKDERDRWKTVRIDATGAGAVAGAAVGAGIAAGVVAAGFLAGPVVVTAGMVWWVERKLVAVDRAVEDPPRRDYDEKVAPVWQPVRVEGFGDSDLEQAAYRFFDVLSESSALTDAMVLADERYEGALKDRELGFALLRYREATRFAEELLERQRLIADFGAETAQRLRDTEARQVIADLAGGESLPDRLIDALPESAQAALFRSGVSVDPYYAPLLLPPRRPEDPFAELADSLDYACRASSYFADTLARGLLQRPENEPFVPPRGSLLERLRRILRTRR